jgi:hypothetical protein
LASEKKKNKKLDLAAVKRHKEIEERKEEERRRSLSCYKLTSVAAV